MEPISTEFSIDATFSPPGRAGHGIGPTKSGEAVKTKGIVNRNGLPLAVASSRSCKPFAQ
jgi:hypothetical protein